MIPQRIIRAWGNVVPWISDEQIEQDLVICKALVVLFSDSFLAENLAFRGGTALHKLYLNPQVRYSEDIDLVQKNSGPIKEIISRLRTVLSFLGEPIIKQKSNNNTLVFRFDSESTNPITLRLKIEINCREHFTVLGYRTYNFSIDTKWYKGKAMIETYKLEELLGSKLRALYQRKKGRDLFDLYQALNRANPDIEMVLLSYSKYMNFSAGKNPSRKQFIINMDNKIQDPDFIGDTKFLLRPTIEYDPLEAYEHVKQTIIERI